MPSVFLKMPLNSQHEPAYMHPDDGFAEAMELPISGPFLPKPRLLSKSQQVIALSQLAEAPPELNTAALILSEKLDDFKPYRIALLDTGVDVKHPCFKGVDIKLESANGNSHDVKDSYGHGTHIAGILSAKSSKINGMAPGAPITSIKVTAKNSGSGRWTHIANALEGILMHSIKNPKDKISVVNLSFNSLDNLQSDLLSSGHRLYSLIQQLYDQNVPVVVSGGNFFDLHSLRPYGSGMAAQNPRPQYGLAYPANIGLTIACGAACHGYGGMKEEEMAPFSQRRPASPAIEQIYLATPAVASFSAGLRGGYSVEVGSSMAAPQVTGVIYLLQQWAKRNQKFNGKLPPVKLIKEALQKGSVPMKNTRTSEYSRNITRFPAMFFDGKSYLHLHAGNALIAFKELTP